MVGEGIVEIEGKAGVFPMWEIEMTHPPHPQRSVEGEMENPQT